MDLMLNRITVLLVEAESAYLLASEHSGLRYAIPILRALKTSYALGEPDKESRYVLGSGLFRTIDGSGLEETELGQALKSLGHDIASGNK